MPSAACVFTLFQNVARSWRLMVRAVSSVTTDPSTRQPIGRSYLRKKKSGRQQQRRRRRVKQ